MQKLEWCDYMLSKNIDEKLIKTDWYNTSQEAHGSQSVVFHHLLVSFDLSTSFKVYFTGTGVILDCPNYGEATVKDMGKYHILNHSKQIPFQWQMDKIGKKIQL